MTSDPKVDPSTSERKLSSPSTMDETFGKKIEDSDESTRGSNPSPSHLFPSSEQDISDSSRQPPSSDQHQLDGMTSQSGHLLAPSHQRTRSKQNQSVAFIPGNHHQEQMGPVEEEKRKSSSSMIHNPPQNSESTKPTKAKKSLKKSVAAISALPRMSRKHLTSSAQEPMISPLSSHTFPYFFGGQAAMLTTETLEKARDVDIVSELSLSDMTKPETPPSVVVPQKETIETPTIIEEKVETSKEEKPGLDKVLSSDSISVGFENPELPEDKIPELGTNIRDILKGKLSFEEYGKRFFVVGLGYECHRFETVQSLTEHISEENQEAESFWIDCQQSSPEDIHFLQKYFGFHPLTAEDCIHNDSGEKWEVFDNYMFIVFTGQIADKVAMNDYLPCHLNLLIFDNCILSVHDKPIEGMDLLMQRIEKEFEIDYTMSKKLRRRNLPSTAESQQAFMENVKVLDVPKDSPRHFIRRSASRGFDEDPSSMDGQTKVVHADQKPKHERKSTSIPSPSWIFYAYLDAIIDMYIPKVDNLTRECDTLDEFTVSLNTSEKEDLLWRIALNKRRAIVLRKLLLPKLKMITYLVSPRMVLPFIEREVQIYLRDVLDHLTYCCDRLVRKIDNIINKFQGNGTRFSQSVTHKLSHKSPN